MLVNTFFKIIGFKLGDCMKINQGTPKKANKNVEK
jgi:hypothetical protein